MELKTFIMRDAAVEFVQDTPACTVQLPQSKSTHDQVWHMPTCLSLPLPLLLRLSFSPSLLPSVPPSLLPSLSSSLPLFISSSLPLPLCLSLSLSLSLSPEASFILALLLGMLPGYLCEDAAAAEASRKGTHGVSTNGVIAISFHVF